MARSPSEKQIALVEEIAKALDIDFPQSSADFTAKTYYKFIKNHIEEMREIQCHSAWTWEDEMSWFRMLN